MRKRIDALVQKHNLPDWFVKVNYWGLLPIVLWPLVFFVTIFLFDNPKNEMATFGLFLLINSYPFLLIGNLLLSFKLFSVARPLSILLPLIPLAAFAYLIIYVFFVSGG